MENMRLAVLERGKNGRTKQNFCMQGLEKKDE